MSTLAARPSIPRLVQPPIRVTLLKASHLIPDLFVVDLSASIKNIHGELSILISEGRISPAIEEEGQHGG